MTNTFAVCLISATLLCCSNLSFAKQVPKECSKGPEIWCQSLKRGADCGAVGHCIATVWETTNASVTSNEISLKFVRLFRQLKDIKDLINEEYLAARISSECHDVQYPAVFKICKENTANLDTYLHHVLKSDTPPETMCTIIGMCNNKKLDNILSMNKKKTPGPSKHKEHLLGSMRCSWGPSYWCSNFSTGRECKATHHCVQRVWPKSTYPEDTDDICKICTDMVKQARDQLESNATQEQLKEVFEGSCKLIPIKIVMNECIKLADDFVPELVETLASQMNPQIVCSVAGLCNSVRIDNLLEDYNEQKNRVLGCNNCQSTVGVLRKTFDETSYEDFLVNLLKVCRNMDSLSDSCSMLVFKYYENILEFVKKDFTPQSMCHVSGQCEYRYHLHDDYNIDTNVAKFSSLDDVPCEFCEQLVRHLRDVMTTNTTELEFYKVLKGLCKQTGKFKDECLHLADEYYPMIYNFLVTDLNPAAICKMIGLCGGNNISVPIAPLVAKEIAIKATTPPTKLIGSEEAKIAHIPLTKKQSNVRVINDTKEVLPPLPIERMFISVPQSNKVACSFCQYFLHYIQVELSDTRTEDEVTAAVQKACTVLPKSVTAECQQFVTQYGPAVIALLVQEIDPATVCPKLGLCPQEEEVKHVAINSDKSNCPLCLFAVEQLETMLQNNRSIENIRKALDGLCEHLSQKLRLQCVDFVDTYTNQLIQMLVSDMTAQEICVFLKLCTNQVHDPLNITKSSIDKYHEKPHLRGDRNNFRKKSLLPKSMLETGKGDVETNEIPDRTVNGHVVKPKAPSTACVICEFVLKEIDDQIKDKHNEDEIKKVVHSVCRRMPKSVRSQCDQFVDKYADLVISLLAQELEPSEVCEELRLCKPTSPNFDTVKNEILDCAVCETVVMAVKKVLSNDAVDRDIVHIVEKSCSLLPAKYYDRCHTMMEVYGESVIHLIEEFGVKGVCQKIGLCSPSESAYVRMYRAKRN